MISILNLIIKGFKGYKEEAEFNFSDYTKITGDNGLGKTSIGEAIMWGLYGCNLNGNSKADSELLNKSSKEIRVKLQFKSNNEYHVVERIKKGKIAEVYLDEKLTTQIQLTSFIGIQKDIFLSIFNPMYFMTLTPSEARKFIADILPNISKEDIFNSLQAEAYPIEIIKYDDFLNPNVYMSRIREKILELEKDYTFMQGSLASKEEEFRKLVINVADTSQAKGEFDEKLLLQYEKEYEELLSQQPIIQDAQSLLKEKNELEKEIIKIKNQRVELEDTMELEKNLSEMYGRLRVMEKQRDKFMSLKDKCPTCGQKIQEDHMVDVIIQFETEISEISSKIQDYQSELNILNELNNEKKNMFQQEILERVSEIKEQISVISQVITEIDENNTRTEIEFGDSIHYKKYKLKKSINELKAIKDSFQKESTEREVMLKNKVDIEEGIKKLKQRLEKNLNDKKELNMKVEALKKFNTKYLEMQNQIISKYLNKTTIELQKLVKTTGELKDCFEIFYEGKEYRLTSTSEKIKTGLEIANLIMNLTSCILPVFIDNSESITTYEKLNTQIIEARVIPNEKISISCSEKSIA